MRLCRNSCVHSISEQVFHSGLGTPILIFPNATNSHPSHPQNSPHPPAALSLQHPTLGLGIPLNIQDAQTPPPSYNPPCPHPPPPHTHTHLIVIDSVFVPLCGAVASDEDTYTELRRCAHCTLHRNYRSATCGRIMSSVQWVSLDTAGHGRMTGWTKVCADRTHSGWAIQARLQASPSVDQGVPAQWAEGPAGVGGSVQRNVSEEAVIRVHPSSGMGTRSNSLTRHKAGCVCARGGGSREGFRWGAGHDLFISINRSLTWPIDMLIQHIHTHTSTHTHACKHMLMCAYVHRRKCTNASAKTSMWGIMCVSSPEWSPNSSESLFAEIGLLCYMKNKKIRNMYLCKLTPQKIYINIYQCELV